MDKSGICLTKSTVGESDLSGRTHYMPSRCNGWTGMGNGVLDPCLLTERLEDMAEDVRSIRRGVQGLHGYGRSASPVVIAHDGRTGFGEWLQHVVQQSETPGV